MCEIWSGAIVSASFAVLAKKPNGFAPKSNTAWRRESVTARSAIFMPRTGHDVRRLELSGDADHDLDRLLTWGTARFGESVADEYFFSFQASFDLLCTHPFAGARYEEVAGDVRVFRHRSHRIFYLVEEDRLLVIRILHGRMDAPRHLR
jgi:toxin ParE1/3/4